MGKSRLEAFSDGVIAIIITIMVLELKMPEGADFNALKSVSPVLFTYVLSFAYIGIYWNNHHHLIHAAHKVNGAILWANTHLLFWLSLIPFVTGWMGENHFATIPVIAYGFILLMCGLAYYILVRTLIGLLGKDSIISRLIGNDFKGKISLVIYALALPLAYVSPWISCLLYIIVAMIWIIPDRRIEGHLKEN